MTNIIKNNNTTDILELIINHGEDFFVGQVESFLINNFWKLSNEKKLSLKNFSIIKDALYSLKNDNLKQNGYKNLSNLVSSFIDKLSSINDKKDYIYINILFSKLAKYVPIEYLLNIINQAIQFNQEGKLIKLNGSVIRKIKSIFKKYYKKDYLQYIFLSNDIDQLEIDLKIGNKELKDAVSTFYKKRYINKGLLQYTYGYFKLFERKITIGQFTFLLNRLNNLKGGHLAPEIALIESELEFSHINVSESVNKNVLINLVNRIRDINPKLSPFIRVNTNTLLAKINNYEGDTIPISQSLINAIDKKVSTIENLLDKKDLFVSLISSYLNNNNIFHISDSKISKCHYLIGTMDISLSNLFRYTDQTTNESKFTDNYEAIEQEFNKRLKKVANSFINLIKDRYSFKEIEQLKKIVNQSGNNNKDIETILNILNYHNKKLLTNKNISLLTKKYVIYEDTSIKKDVANEHDLAITDEIKEEDKKYFTYKKAVLNKDKLIRDGMKLHKITDKGEYITKYNNTMQNAAVRLNLDQNIRRH